MYRNLSSLWYKRENEKKKHSEEAIIEFVNTNIIICIVSMLEMNIFLL